ncbi:MAG: hypothetical protein ACM32I_10740 [Nitrospirota bacterium]
MVRILLIIGLLASFSVPGLAAQKKAGGSAETLHQSVEELKKKPADNALREKIIKLALTMKPAPAVPEDAERSMARGIARFQRAADSVGYKKAISEFEAAANAAPWLAAAYYNLGMAQEKAGLYSEAIRNLKYYLLAAPDAKNARDVKNKIYALEVDAEDLQAGKNDQAPPAAPPADSGSGKPPRITGRASMEIAPAEKQLTIIKMLPPEKKPKMPSFIGAWYFKDFLRGEELTIEAFEISKNASGDLILTPPKRAAESYASVTQLEISDRNLKLQLLWKMRSIVGYWKTETYELTLSEDGKTLTGSHTQKSVGGRTIEMDRVLFRQ